MDLGRRLLVFLFTAVFEKMRRKKGEQLLSPRSRAHRSEPRAIKILKIVFFSSRNSNWMEVSASPTSSAIVEVQDEPASSGSNCKVLNEDFDLSLPKFVWF